MNLTDFYICETQGDIYVYMAKKGYDMNVFSDNYLKSDFCRREFDTEYSRYQDEFPNECADFYMPEIGDNLVHYPFGCCFDLEEAEWIGFAYRQLYLETGIYSSELADIVPFEEMREYYKKFGKNVVYNNHIARVTYDRNIERMIQDSEIVFNAISAKHKELKKISE